MENLGKFSSLSVLELYFYPLKIPLSIQALGASGGELLVPPRSSARMRLKEALTAACSRRRADVSVVRLPQAIDLLDSLRDAPPSLRILPARSHCRIAGFRSFLSKSEHLSSRSLSTPYTSKKLIQFQFPACPASEIPPCPFRVRTPQTVRGPGGRRPVCTGIGRCRWPFCPSGRYSP